ncbi:transketolase [Amycolatopsis sp. NPDC059657]|uniref:transketolase n=1 Tax=Amycolatopsis sp. NPDC059657 TaxID=3346899 RepID=UPI00366DC9A2
MTTATELDRLMSLMTGDEKHDAAATSTLDVLWTLYDRVLGRNDRFFLSKGHGPMAFYAVLTAKGFLDESELKTWGRADSRLGYHPDRTRVPGAEISSGSLGHGLPLAVGTVFGLDARKLPGDIVVLVGDAELDEGSNAEAIAVAGREGMERLTVVVIDNSSATHGWPGGIASRFAVEGWETRTVDGRDHDALHHAFTEAHPGRPLAVVAVVEPKG